MLVTAILKKILKIIVSLLILFIGTSVLAVILYRYVEVPFTPLMGIRMIQQVGNGRIPHADHKWVPLDSMSCYMPVAVIASEDQNFLSHNGFDLNAIESILKEQYEKGGLKV